MNRRHEGIQARRHELATTATRVQVQHTHIRTCSLSAWSHSVPSRLRDCVPACLRAFFTHPLPPPHVCQISKRTHRFVPNWHTLATICHASVGGKTNPLLATDHSLLATGYRPHPRPATAPGRSSEQFRVPNVSTHMKTLRPFEAVTLLLILTATPCSAEMMIEHLTLARAKELGIQFRATPARADTLRCVLEFDVKGELQSFTRVTFELKEGGKLLLSSTLKDEQPRQGHVIVSFTADRAKLSQITLRILTSEPSLGGSAYELRPSEFIDSKKPAAAAPQGEETRFLGMPTIGGEVSMQIHLAGFVPKMEKTDDAKVKQ